MGKWHKHVFGVLVLNEGAMPWKKQRAYCSNYRVTKTFIILAEAFNE